MKAKLCGMKTLEAASAAEKAGADFIGFLFWPGSKRYVSPEQAYRILQGLGQRRAKAVGVFVDEDPDKVREIAGELRLDFVQLHGHEDEDYARKLGCPVIKAFSYHPGFDARRAGRYPADLLLLDSGTKQMPGGTGIRFGWREAARVTADLSPRLLIAGGINEANLKEAEACFHPYGVDVSGSLETDGEKDVKKIRSFMKRLHEIPAGEENNL